MRILTFTLMAVLTACGVDPDGTVFDIDADIDATDDRVERMRTPIGSGNQDTGTIVNTGGNAGGNAGGATGGTTGMGGVTGTGGAADGGGTGTAAGGTSATGGMMATGGATGGTPATGGAGGTPSCVPVPEILNGKDEDCDGAVDNGFAVTQFNGSLYFRGNVKDTWIGTRAYCQSIGYDMIVVSSAAEHAYIVSASLDSWIGLTDEGSEGQWRWVDGSSVAYTKWDAGQPNNFGGNENCVVAGTTGWGDLNCQQTTSRVVCEKVLR